MPNAGAGFVERQEPDPAAVKQIAEELRAAAGILKRAAPTGTDDAQATDTQAPELNDTERTICEAINQLWADGHEWPGARVIADKSGYVEQTVKNTVAHLVRSKALAKGENGRGYKVRT